MHNKRSFCLTIKKSHEPPLQRTHMKCDRTWTSGLSLLGHNDGQLNPLIRRNSAEWCISIDERTNTTDFRLATRPNTLGCVSTIQRYYYDGQRTTTPSIYLCIIMQIYYSSAKHLTHTVRARACVWKMQFGVRIKTWGLSRKANIYRSFMKDWLNERCNLGFKIDLLYSQECGNCVTIILSIMP